MHVKLLLKHTKLGHQFNYYITLKLGCHLIHNINNAMYYLGDNVVVGQWYATTKFSKILNFGLKG
jgi:hypothetical protein